MAKLKEIWFRIQTFGFYLKLSFKRWTSPRVYVVQYSYTDSGGNARYDAHVVRAIHLDLRAVTHYLQTHTDGSNLIVMGVSEVPWNMYNTPLLDVAEQFVKRVDEIADNLSTDTKPQEVVEDEDDDEEFNDGTHMLR